MTHRKGSLTPEQKVEQQARRAMVAELCALLTPWGAAVALDVTSGYLAVLKGAHQPVPDALAVRLRSALEQARTTPALARLQALGYTRARQRIVRLLLPIPAEQRLAIVLGACADLELPMPGSPARTKRTPRR